MSLDLEPMDDCYGETPEESRLREARDWLKIAEEAARAAQDPAVFRRYVNGDTDCSFWLTEGPDSFGARGIIDEIHAIARSLEEELAEAAVREDARGTPREAVAAD